MTTTPPCEIEGLVMAIAASTMLTNATLIDVPFGGVVATTASGGFAPNHLPDPGLAQARRAAHGMKVFDPDAAMPGP
jgi:hypothetical protein